MDAFKQAVVQTLEKQGIIAQLKVVMGRSANQLLGIALTLASSTSQAQLRAQVFLAVEEYESTSTGLGEVRL